MNWLFATAEFARRIRYQLRFGERSRLPLKLVRLEVRENFAECEWMARQNDPWDADLPAEVREQNETWQALRDALSVREALFTSMPQLQVARLKAYRMRNASAPDLIITGEVSREDEPPPRLSSIVMRAKLYGFHFNLCDGSFEALSMKTGKLQFANQ
jgi:hypothetical protein